MNIQCYIILIHKMESTDNLLAPIILVYVEFKINFFIYKIDKCPKIIVLP